MASKMKKSQMLENIHKTTGSIPTNFAGLKKADLAKMLKKPENASPVHAPFGRAPVKKLTPSQKASMDQLFRSPYRG
jgi:hypothetical protein